MLASFTTAWETVMGCILLVMLVLFVLLWVSDKVNRLGRFFSGQSAGTPIQSSVDREVEKMQRTADEIHKDGGHA